MYPVMWWYPVLVLTLFMGVSKHEFKASFVGKSECSLGITKVTMLLSQLIQLAARGRCHVAVSVTVL